MVHPLKRHTKMIRIIVKTLIYTLFAGSFLMLALPAIAISVADCSDNARSSATSSPADKELVEQMCELRAHPFDNFRDIF